MKDQLPDTLCRGALIHCNRIAVVLMLHSGVCIGSRGVLNVDRWVGPFGVRGSFSSSSRLLGNQSVCRNFSDVAPTTQTRTSSARASASSPPNTMTSAGATTVFGVPCACMRTHNQPRIIEAATKEQLQTLLDSVDCFIFDCDGATLRCLAFALHMHNTPTGVIWKGDKLIPGVPETLEYLRSLVRWPQSWETSQHPLPQGKKLFFVTNNSTKSRKGYLNKFTSLGLSITAVRADAFALPATYHGSMVTGGDLLIILCRGCLPGEHPIPQRQKSVCSWRDWHS